MGNTKECVRKLTNMRGVWMHFLVAMKSLVLHAGKSSSNFFRSLCGLGIIENVTLYIMCVSVWFILVCNIASDCI